VIVTFRRLPAWIGGRLPVAQRGLPAADGQGEQVEDVHDSPRRRLARRAGPIVLLAAVLCWTPAWGGGQPPRAIQSQQNDRLFPPLDLGLLEAPDRDAWQKPDLIMDALGIADGAVVADLGAGGGWFTSRLARRVGPNGVVYAQDIQPQMIDAIARRVQRENLRNVQTILGTALDPRLPRGLDAVLIVDSYHEMNDPARPEVIRTLLGNVAKALKPQGRVGIVGFTPGGGGPGPPPNERIDPEAVIAAASSAGLRLVGRERVPPFQFLLVFGRAPAPDRVVVP
jgi:SAM-dependent methyltransferase